MNTPGEKLIELIAPRFPKLTDDENKLLHAVASGEVAQCGDQAAAQNDPQSSDTWGQPGTVDAKVIRWLCVDPEAVRHIDPKGIRLDAAKVSGQLDLNCVTVPFPLVLRGCTIRAGVNLQRAETRFLSFEGSYTGPITGAGLVVRGDIHLRNGFQANGEVGLYGAKISGDIACDGGIFLNAGGRALNVGGASVGGQVSLRKGFQAEGEVTFYRAEIGSDLACDGGIFLNAGERALNAGGVSVRGQVSLRGSFRAEGEVGLYGAKIGGNLVCDGGIFVNAGRRALNAGGVTVGGQVSLRDGFRADGEVNLYRAAISGDLACDGGAFLNIGGLSQPALAAGGVTVGGQVSLRGGFRAEGGVGLYGAKIGGNLVCDGGIFVSAGRRALNAGGVTVGGQVSLRDGLRAEGEVGLYGAKISGDLVCDGGSFLNAGGRALAAGGVTVGGQLSMGDGFRAEGEVGLYGAKIGGDLSGDGAIFLNIGGRALNAGGVTVGGSVLLRKSSQAEGFRAEGEVGLYETRITGKLDCTGGVFLNSGDHKYALNARAVVVGSDTFLRNDFQAEGLVRLVGADIGTHLDCKGARFTGKPCNGLLAERIVVKGLFDWRKVDATAETVLDLWGARVGQLADDEESCPGKGKLDLDDFIYAAIAEGPMDKDSRVSWLERQTSQPLDSQLEQPVSQSTSFRSKPYQHLAKVLRESGQEAEGTRILIAKEEARRQHGKLGWLAWCGNWVLGKTMAHGYQPQRLLVGAAVFVLLGGWLFGAGYQAGAMARTKKAESDTPYPSFSRWMYSLDTFLPIINFGQKDYWSPESSSPPSLVPPPLRPALSVDPASLTSPSPSTVTWVRFLRVYRWIHIGVGWLLITLGIAGVTGLVRKE